MAGESNEAYMLDATRPSPRTVSVENGWLTGHSPLNTSRNSRLKVALWNFAA